MVDNKVKIDEIFKILKTVNDPEIPVLNVIEMGMVREVECIDDDKFRIIMTPTYSGCPAVDAIREDVSKALNNHGIDNFELKTRLFPAWTTDWMTEEAKIKLKEFGIAPPESKSTDPLAHILGKAKETQCPYCNSNNTRMTSTFGSTACKSMHYCDNCKQPFEHFKCH